MKFKIIAAVCLCIASVNAVPSSEEHYEPIRTFLNYRRRESVGRDGTNHVLLRVDPPDHMKLNRHRESVGRDRTSHVIHRVDPPDHTKLIPMARYVLHTADWASVATISTMPTVEGFPFANVKSIVDGSLANSTGVPYFYMAPADFTARDLIKNNRATVQVSLEESKYCDSQKWDPEDPRCTRLMLTGRMKRIKVNTPEYKFAQAALFERHPDMMNWPKDHQWFVAKLKIAQIAMVDWFGGAKLLPVKEYLAYNYTGNEMLMRAERLQAQNEITYV